MRGVDTGSLKSRMFWLHGSMGSWDLGFLVDLGCKALATFNGPSGLEWVRGVA